VTIAGHTITADPKLVAGLPAAIKSAGELKDITYNNAPPDEAVVDGKLVGWEVDLGQAVAATLGLKWNATASGAFDTFIPGLQNGRYNVSFTSFIQTPERLKQIDIVTYFNIGTGFAVKSGSSIKVQAPTDVCGHTVSVIAGSAFIQQIQGIDCAGAGKPPAKVQSFPSDSAAELAVSSGRVEIYSSSMDQLAWLVEQTHGQFSLQPLNYQPVPAGAGVTKGIGLTKSIAAAMDKLIESGAYKDIMKKWGQSEGLVDKATIYSTAGPNGS
jgi:polar amino acid transport system substrate-binding protein